MKRAHQCFSLILGFFMIGFFMIAFSCTRREAQREYLVEKVDNVAIVQVYADEFKKLSLKQKMLAYYLYRAAIAGRDITYDQDHKYALEIRKILEGIVTHPEEIDKPTYDAILKYTKLFWINNGQYDNLTSRKFVPEVDYEKFLGAARTAALNGADLGIKAGETLEEKLERLKPYIFDPNFEPILTNKTPGPGEDLITGSANNLYEGVTLTEMEAFDEKYPLNSKAVKLNGKIVEQVYRAGTDEIPPGLYAEQLKNVIRELENALPYAEKGQDEVLKQLIRYFKTGDPEDFRKYNILWVRNKSFFDTINGFIEVYKDARAVKGEYEAVVYFVDLKTTQLMRSLAANAQYFEDNAPWKDEYKKKDIKV
ncbi:MAG: peptidase, partial [Fidelibacterota bacterium]